MFLCHQGLPHPLSLSWQLQPTAISDFDLSVTVKVFRQIILHFFLLNIFSKENENSLKSGLYLVLLQGLTQ